MANTKKQRIKKVLLTLAGIFFIYFIISINSKWNN